MSKHPLHALISYSGVEKEEKQEDAGTAELRSKLLKDFSPPNRSMDVVRGELKPCFKHYDAYIAGGFAADPTLATDVDVFVLIQEHETNDVYDLMAEWGMEDISVGQSRREFYEGMISDNSYRFIGKLPSGMPLDVIFTTKPSIKDVLETFDHPSLGIAVEVATGSTIMVPTVTKHWKLGKKNPLRELYRRLKVCTRYGIPTKREENELSGVLVQCITRWEASRIEKDEQKQLPADWKLLVSTEIEEGLSRLKEKLAR